MKKIIVFFVTIELIAIGVLTRKIITKSKQSVLGKQSIHSIKKSSLIFSSTKYLKNFYEPKPNSIDTGLMFKRGRITINSDSLNERFNYSIQKPKSTFRIITLGDSFTYGLYIDTKDNWTEILEDELNNKLTCKNIRKFEVINLGVHGYDFQYSVERYKKRGVKYNPDLIIWYMVDPLRLTYININPTALNKAKKECEKEHNSYIYCPWGKVHNNYIKRFGETQILDFQKKSMMKLNEYYSGPLLFMMDYGFPPYQKKFFTRVIKKRGKKSWITDIYIPNSYRILNDGHPNEKGHKKIANDVFDFLIKNNIIPCKTP